jgi:hypothetical protein
MKSGGDRKTSIFLLPLSLKHHKIAHIKAAGEISCMRLKTSSEMKFYAAVAAGAGSLL